MRNREFIGGREKKRKKFLVVVLDVMIFLLIGLATFVIFKLTFVKRENRDSSSLSVGEAEMDDDDEEDEGMNLAKTIVNWETFGKGGIKYGIYIYDLDNSKLVGSRRETETFAMESLYKLLVAYEGYIRIENGSFDREEIIVDGLTTGQCLDKMVRESNSPCAETLLFDKIGEEELNTKINQIWDLKNTNLDTFMTTAEDMGKFLKILFEHRDVSEASIRNLKDSMLNQPEIEDASLCEGTCNLRQGLPKGFTRGTKVYDKVGWNNNNAYWVAYNDAAILEFPKNRHFAIVLLTSGFATTSEIVKFGDLVEEAILAYLDYE